MFADGFVKACVKLLDTTASRLSPQRPWRLPIVQHAAHRRYGSALIGHLSQRLLVHRWVLSPQKRGGKELCRHTLRPKASARQLRAVLIDKIYEVFPLLRGRLSADEISNGCMGQPVFLVF